MLYASESWTMTRMMLGTLQESTNACKGVNTLVGQNIQQGTLKEMGEEPVLVQLRREIWKWLGHTLR